MKDLQKEKKIFEIWFPTRNFFTETTSRLKVIVVKKENQDRDSIRNRLKHKPGLSWAKRSITWDPESEDEFEVELKGVIVA